MAANSSVYFLRIDLYRWFCCLFFPDKNERRTLEALTGRVVTNLPDRTFIIFDKPPFIIEKSYKNMTMHTFIAFSLFFPYTISGYPFCIYTRSAISYSSLSESSQPRQGSVMDLP